MRQERDRQPDSAEKTVRDIRRAARRRFSAEDKIRIVLEGLRGGDQSGRYRWCFWKCVSIKRPKSATERVRRSSL